MDTMHVDILVLGFGKGGKTLAATMGRQGRRVAMVERFADGAGEAGCLRA